MCGISGFFHFSNDQSADLDVLKRMTDCILHRGPDGEGYYVEKNVALGHRRLSIIDLSTGDQPMYSDDKNIVIVFNGEIYNYIELKKELQVLGHVFKTDSDTEVIIRSYQEWGYDCQKKFNGMWAFALFDKNKNELFLSRDRIGEKPLHYAVHKNSFVFGSEIKSILKFGVPEEINMEVTELFLFLTYIPAPHTYYKNIYKLKPVQFLIVKDGQVKELKYWDLPKINESRMNKNKKEVYTTFEALLTDSVRLRMRSDVPFGAFLSGGLDSSSVVAIMSKQSKFPIETFTIGFKEKAFDESALATAVSIHFKTNHHLFNLEPDSFEESLKKVIYHFDEPFGDSSAIPTGYVSKEAAKHVKMVLTGDGGDEVLSGYNSYLGIKITDTYNRLPKFLRRGVPKALNSVSKYVSNDVRYKLNRMVNVSSMAELDFNDRFIHKMAYTDYGYIKALVGNEKVIPIEDFISDFFASVDVKDDFYKMMYFDFKQNLPGDYLVKVDRMSMAYSLETRVPFLDHRLIEYMVQVDKSVKLEGWKTKSVLRNTIGKSLPDSLLTAPKKGFGVPLREWFKADSFEPILESLKSLGFLNTNAISAIVDENRSGARDNGNFIWSLFVLKNWLS